MLHQLDTFNPLCSAKPVSLTTSLNSWGKVICYLCAGFHVALTPVEASCHCQLATPSEATPFSYWSIKPWFYYRGKTCCCAHHTFSLGVPNSATLINLASRFSGAVADIKIFWRRCRGGKETTAHHTPSSTQRHKALF